MELLDRCRLWLGLISGGMTLGVPEGGGGDVAAHRVAQIGNLDPRDHEIRMLMR